MKTRTKMRLAVDDGSGMTVDGGGEGKGQSDEATHNEWDGNVVEQSGSKCVTAGGEYKGRWEHG